MAEAPLPKDEPSIATGQSPLPVAPAQGKKEKGDTGKGGRSRASDLDPLEALKAFLLERDVTLKEGWTFQKQPRKPGTATEKMADVYYFSPTKQKFRSKPEVYKHLTGQADPPKEKKEKGAPRASPRTRADLHLEAKKHLAKNAAHLPEIDKMKVRSLGELAARFHDTDKLFPVGYCTEWHHAAFNCVFISKILKSGDEGPLFRVEAWPIPKPASGLGAAAGGSAAAEALSPPPPASAAGKATADGAASGSGVAAAGSSHAPWPAPLPAPPQGYTYASKAQEVTQRTFALGYSPDEAWDVMYRTFPALAFTGEHFGLHLPEVAHLLEGLEGAADCERYQFVANWATESKKRKNDLKLHDVLDADSGWTFERITSLEERRKKRDLPPEEAEKLAAELAEYEAHRKLMREKRQESQRAVLVEAKESAKQAKERAREQAQAQREARAKINRYPVEDLEVPMREREDALIKGEAPPEHPPRPEAAPLGPETGDVLSVSDFLLDEFVAESDMAPIEPFLLRLAVNTPGESPVLGELYCALLKATLASGADKEEKLEKYAESQQPPPPAWLKYLKKDGPSLWPELFRRWIVCGPCSDHYSAAEIEMATTLATKGPGAVDGQTHLTLLRHLCDDVLHTTHARKVMEKNTEARDKIGKEFREREKRLREIEKAHAAAKQAERDAKEEIERAREALSNPGGEGAAAAAAAGAEGDGAAATPPPVARRMTSAEAREAARAAEDKLKEAKATIKELESHCRFRGETMWADEHDEVAADLEKKLAAVILRASPIGLDRDLVRYWWFERDPGCIYTERPPPEEAVAAAEGKGDGEEESAAGPSGEAAAVGGGSQAMETEGGGSGGGSKGEQSPVPPAAASGGVAAMEVDGGEGAGAGAGVEHKPGATPGATTMTPADGLDGAAAAAPEAEEEEGEFDWGKAAWLVEGAASTVTSQWARYTTPEELEQLLAALFHNGVRERKLLAALRRMKDAVVKGMAKREALEEHTRKMSVPKPDWFEKGYSGFPGAIRVAADEAFSVASRVAPHRDQGVVLPMGFEEWLRNLKEYNGQRSSAVSDAPETVIQDIAAGLLLFEESVCASLDSRATRPPAAVAERAAAEEAAEAAEDAHNKDGAEAEGVAACDAPAEAAAGPESLFQQGLEDEAFSEWNEAFEERVRGANVFVEARPAPHSTKPTQIWRGPFGYLVRRNWRAAVSRAAGSGSAAQLAYAAVAFSERMQPALSALEKQSKKAPKKRAEEGRPAPSGRAAKSKRARVEAAAGHSGSDSGDSD